MTAGIKANSDGSAAIQVGGTDVITLTSGGAATFVTSPTTVQAGTAAAPSITFSGDTNTGIYSPGADTVGITAGGTLVGSVGLGTTLALQGATSQSGTGITFPATQSASTNANTLDDYEEGTWTPTFSSTGATFTYDVQLGRYTKIGNIVHAACYLGGFVTGTKTNPLLIGSLPFAVANISSYYPTAAVGQMFCLDWIADAKQVNAYGAPNSSAVTFEFSKDDAASVAVTADAIRDSGSGSTYLMINISYQAA